MSEFDEAYATFVDTDADIEGLLAYAIYKRHELRWLSQHVSDNGKKPTPSEYATFVKSAITSEHQYLTESADALIAFAEEVVEGRRPEIEKRAVEGKFEAVETRIISATSFWQTVLSSIIGFLAVSLLLVIVAFSAQKLGIDLLDAIGLQGPS